VLVVDGDAVQVALLPVGEAALEARERRRTSSTVELISPLM